MEPPAPPDAVYLQARAAWPGVVLAREDFLAHLAARAASSGGAQAPHVEDLYLACACAKGLPPALAHFERLHLPAARHALARRGLSPDVVDEALQRLRERLLLARPDGPPRVAEYDGRGPLEAWVRTVALRLAMTELRERAMRPAEALIPALMPPDDASFAALKHRHHADIEASIAAALASLEPRQRTFLRLHLVENVGVEDIGKVHGVSRATMTRWLKAARDTLAERTHAELRRRLNVGESELHSLAHSLLSGLDLSVRHLLR
ncbi:sigma-70 family RNA polymerase sigma factor [Corallococcus llansteffanensis]|uniref:Sigma-70 family RNA polymerase sigma factor n=1 Tax=Corallococcus llansteffanensis TaxID=2316731 RepID=A0A3A8P1Q2_9BACT|nr:sigma-70 family RNA polymerase sigma factor [Corallococcus llansteffanensis]RKH50516.1 sigma-70 family RNA polymerase sigma factor [Corallococcus llansteffanensis]